MLIIGLMSGTSLDGVDAVLVETDGENNHKFLSGITLPYDASFRKNLFELAQPDSLVNPSDIMRLEKELTEKHSEAVGELLKKSGVNGADVKAVGFHGQTIRHIPEEQLTWQMGNANLLSEQTGIAVVSDFRRRDMACGGQGAPLVPHFHEALFANFEKPCVILNIGGVANVTLLKDDGIIASDVGPGIGLLDAWIQKKTDLPFDKDGAIAKQGAVDTQWVQYTASDPFFDTAWPKSVDRYLFNNMVPDHLGLEDGARTLCALTAETIASALKAQGMISGKIYVHGGGGYHPVLMQDLKDKAGLDVVLLDEIGQQANYLEAECFAWLAARRLKNLPFTSEKTTGCQRESVGGILTTA
jgi:anhydro-N-acetylmuramic acid kinase